MATENLYEKFLKELEQKRQESMNIDSKRVSLDEAISQGYDNNVINAMKAFRNGSKRIQITRDSYLERDQDYHAWSIIYKRELGHVCLQNEEFIVDTWNRIRNL